MSGRKYGLRPDKIRNALAAVTAWRRNPESAVACPVCGETGLAIEDHSTRPHAEWYAIACTACGLGDMIHIPGATPGRSVR